MSDKPRDFKKIHIGICDDCPHLTDKDRQITLPQAELRLEYCSLCGEPTGHAGASEDSVYIETNGREIGPLCHTCLDGIRRWIDADSGFTASEAGKDRQIASLQSELHVARTELTEMKVRIKALNGPRTCGECALWLNRGVSPLAAQNGKFCNWNSDTNTARHPDELACHKFQPKAPAHE